MLVGDPSSPGFERIAAELQVTFAAGSAPFARGRSTTATTDLFFLPSVDAGARSTSPSASRRRAFREIAVLMSIGLLIDALMLRIIVVPALVTIVGERSGWPGRSLARRAAQQDAPQTPVPDATG